MLNNSLIAIAGLALAVVAVVAYASTRPDTFVVQRAASINAPPERIFPLIASLRQMNEWNPFVSSDPAIEIAYSGPESGKGAAHTWDGDREVGAGRIEITDAVTPFHVVMRLDMARPMAAQNQVEFMLAPNGDSTTVTWAMSGRQPLLGKVMSLFIDCEKMVGNQFEKGLASLKAIAER
ncbi:MAG: SRPBCC family protein [Methylocystis sp.]